MQNGAILMATAIIKLVMLSEAEAVGLFVNGKEVLNGMGWTHREPTPIVTDNFMAERNKSDTIHQNRSN